MHKRLYIAFILLAGLSSCGVKKFIPEGKYLSTDAKVVIEHKEEVETDDKALKRQLESVLRPRPNSKFLGRPGLWAYYKNQKEKPGFINRFLYKKIGEDPVYNSEVNTSEVEDLLLNRLDNRGYFYSRASSHVDFDEKKKESEVTYTVVLEKPYTMAALKLDSFPEPLGSAIAGVMEETLLEPGQRFDLGRMKAERQRIDVALKTRGYYNFNGSFLSFEADTNQHSERQFDLFMKLKMDVPHKATIPYAVEELQIYPTVGLGDTLTQDTVTVDAIDFVGGEEFFNAKRLAPFVTMEPGQLYDSRESKATARRLSTIGVYRFVNIQYETLDSDTLGQQGQLRSTIELSPLNKRAFRAELQAVSKSNNFAGPALATTYTNRNLFKGGEILNLTGEVGYELQVGRKSQYNYNLTLGASAEIIFPRVLLPWIKIDTDFFKYDIPKTRVGLSVDHSNRSNLYRLISATATFGYDWNAAQYVNHSIDFVSINYNNVYQTSTEFEQMLDDNAYLRRSFQQQFIAGLIYTFTYNELVDTRIKGALYFNANFDTAGNLLGLFSKKHAGGEPATTLGLEYAQYAKLDLDIRYHYRMRKEKTLAMRLFGGYGLPYGNSDVMPFIKQYSSGGPYSIRAFNIRSIGPGSYEEPPSDNSSAFFEQLGNIKLEANLEFRFPIISYLKGAVFTDIGNIWLSEDNPDLPGGTFGSNAFSELAMGAGVGLRVDVQGFVIRFDFAAPYHSPRASENSTYTFDVKETQFNFAIGYPF